MSARQSRDQIGPKGDELNYYELLGVPYTASFQEITRAYREKMKRAHPDRERPDRRASAEERAKLLNLAFATLSRADARRAYDVEIKAQVVQGQIMGRYMGGFVSTASDPHGESLRRSRSAAERIDQRNADRSAVVSVFTVFAGIAIFVIALLALASFMQGLLDWLN